MKKIHLFIGCGMLLALLNGCNAKEKVDVITSREDLVVAINHANDGDTIFVGDIDFRTEPQLHKSITRVALSKSLTFKSGSNKKATFTSGSFILEGTKVAGESLKVSFENIDFDGAIEGKKLKDLDWEYADPDDIEPRMCQYATLFKGNVDASYNNCTFSNYMNENGGALWALYGDYAGIDSILLNYGDNSLCKLNIDINGCSFKDNYAYYGGGAMYFEGNKQNVDIKVANTNFEGNKSSAWNMPKAEALACWVISHLHSRNALLQAMTEAIHTAQTKKNQLIFQMFRLSLSKIIFHQ